MRRWWSSASFLTALAAFLGACCLDGGPVSRHSRDYARQREQRSGSHDGAQKALPQALTRERTELARTHRTSKPRAERRRKTFFGGSFDCRFGDCNKHGARLKGGGNVDCRFGDCNKHGATIRRRDGKRASVDCRFGDCNKHGATIRRSDGRTSSMDCRFGDCNKHGATIRHSDGGRTTIDCRFGDCNKHGWTERRSNGKTRSCSCRFGDCNKHGSSCN